MSRVMSCKNGGDLTAAVDDSHYHERDDHATIRNMGDADSEENESCSDREPFFQCTDGEEPLGVELLEDAGTEFRREEDDEDGDDVRVSFATAVGDRLWEEQAELDLEVLDEEDEDEDVSRYDYGMWMATEPMSIQERRRRLLHGMGLTSSWDLLRSRNARMRVPPNIPRSAPLRRPQPAAAFAVADEATSTAAAAPAPAAASPVNGRRPPNASLRRCRSDSRLPVGCGVGRKPQTFRRSFSLPHSMQGALPDHKARSPLPSAALKDDGNGNVSHTRTRSGFKNLDNGKELMLNDSQNGVQVSVDELDRFMGYTPLATQVIRRSQSQPVSAAANGGANPGPKKRTRWLKNNKLVASVARLINEKHKYSSTGGIRWPSVATMSKSASAHPAVSSSGTAGPPERLKVHHYGKASKELTGLYIRQELRAHEGSIWTMKFNPDARFLATGGEDRVVRVWRVVDDADSAAAGVAQELSSASVPPLPADTDGKSEAPGLAAQLSKKLKGRSSKHVLPEHIVVPETVFALAEQPACSFDGHQDDVLDLSWSKSQQLLSSSMDKTVRLWDMDTQTCLKLFAHNDYVTCVQFNPVDDGYFISGSLDNKVRIWSVPERQVVDWSNLNDMVTAACYTPDGQAAILGSHKGSCRFYKTTDCKLNQEAQIDMSISKKRKSQAKKITGFQFAPGNPSEILVTSADSQIRVFNGITVLQKFKGFKNTSSQMSASYTADGRYVVCASEDSHVYLWRRGGAPGGVGVGGGVSVGSSAGGGGGGGIGVRAKTWLTNRAYEYFFCRDVSVAVPWPGSPTLRPRASSVHGGGSDASRSGRWGDGDAADSDVAPRRPKSGPMTYDSSGGRQTDVTRREPVARWHGGAEGGNAWGLVVVTASRGGEIRVYQNFGLPLGVRGQSNRFH